ncbi:MAG: hypothetical protein WHT07_11980 [Desulfobaccales bacterium]
MRGGRGSHRSPCPPLKILSHGAYPALAAAHLAVAASGTVTVEAALAGTPTIIVYRLSRLTYLLGRLLVRVRYIGMANLLAGEEIFPELLQDDFRPESVVAEVVRLLQDPARLENIKRGLSRVVTSLGGPGAAARAAAVAVEILSRADKS